jgi:putative transposase
MPQSLAQIHLHLVFSTKNRYPFQLDHQYRDAMHAYLATVCSTMESPSLRVGGVADHVHLLVSFGRVGSVAELIRELKRSSSKWIKTQSKDLGKFEWQHGYGAFSVSPSHVEVLIEYIKNQETHHRKMTFQDEFRKLLKKYSVQYDERYVWD